MHDGTPPGRRWAGSLETGTRVPPIKFPGLLASSEWSCKVLKHPGLSNREASGPTVGKVKDRRRIGIYRPGCVRTQFLTSWLRVSTVPLLPRGSLVWGYRAPQFDAFHMEGIMHSRLVTCSINQANRIEG